VETAARLCRADKVQILLPSESTNRVYSAASFGYSTEYNEYLKTTTFAPGREGVVGRVLLGRKPVQIADVLADPEYRLREMFGGISYSSRIAAPSRGQRHRRASCKSR
jgi:hypothetical protein